MKYRKALTTAVVFSLAVLGVSACRPKDGRIPYAPKTSPAIGTKAIVTCRGPILNECATRQDDGSYILHREGMVETIHLPGTCILRAENKAGRTFIYVPIKKGCYRDR